MMSKVSMSFSVAMAEADHVSDWSSPKEKKTVREVMSFQESPSSSKNGYVI